MSVLQSILIIGNHMVRARIYQAIGDLEEANEEMLGADWMAESDGYHHAASGNQNEDPSYLTSYPELRSSWQFGYEQGADYLEIRQCRSCQDSEVQLCPAHD